MDLTIWVEQNRGYIVKITEKYAPIWGITFDEAKAWINEQLPEIHGRCKGTFTGAYVASALINRRTSLVRSDARRNADLAHGTVDHELMADVLVAKQIEPFSDDGQILTVSHTGVINLVTVYGGEIVGNIELSNIGRVMIQANEEQIRVIDCE